ncbi:CYTH domain-containing protein [bacterium]|nr:CYTH domain-containing protein [bacterium]
MGVEIERKFLVTGDGWRDQADPGQVFRQGYLTTVAERTVRVRRAGDRAWLTIKGRPEGRVRAEFEYEIPAADADELLALCEPTPIDKTRYRLEHAGHVWEVDVFAGANAPLVVAEVELPDAGTEVALPAWVGQEVTDDPRYQNARLSREPYGTWGATGRD